MSTVEVVVRAMLPSVSMCTMRSSVDDQALTRVERLDVSSFVIPTDGHESDGLGGWASSGMSRVK